MTEQDTLQADISTALRITPPAEAAQKARAEYWLGLVDAMPVESQETFEMAAEELRKLNHSIKVLDEERTALVSPLNGVVKALNARFMPYLKGMEQAQASLKQKMSSWHMREQARIADERRKAEAEAAAERARLAAQAREAQRAADAAAAAAAESANQAKNDEEAQAAVAAAEKARIQAQHAEAAQTAAMVVTAVAVAPVRKAAGVSSSSVLDFEVEDKLALMRFVLEERPDLAVLLDVNAANVRAHIKMHRLQSNLPGVRVFESTRMSVR